VDHVTDDAHSLIERAFRIAAAAHEGQFRKGSRLPYFAHPSAVALLLARSGISDPVILAAALLHDVLEDTELTVETLEVDFPSEVVDCVRAASEHKFDADGRRREWEDRKVEHVARVHGASSAARAVVLADKVHNLQSIWFDLSQGDPVWERFNAPRDRVLAYHAAMIDAAAGSDAEMSPLADLGRELLERIRALETT